MADFDYGKVLIGVGEKVKLTIFAKSHFYETK
jgi:hypothetical protein